MEEFDTIIIGAGSAGCVLAGQLSKKKSHGILLLEAGGKDTSPWVHIPIGYGKTFFHPDLNWQYHTEPEPALNGRSGYWPRGKVVGGSGAINAMVYARGLPHDFNDWQDAGATGWNAETVTAAYDEMETQIASDGTETGTGPMTVQDVSDQIHPINRHFFDAAKELHYPYQNDYNQPPYEGAIHYRINTRHGRRNASSRAFLKPALRRSNLVMRVRALVDRIHFENNRAVAVSYLWRGKEHKVRAKHEIILSAGAIVSPLILQRSGIGDGHMLNQHGIMAMVDNPNVGAHMQDHLGINYYFKANQPTLNNVLYSWPGRIKIALQYAFTRRGVMALSVNQCGGYFRSNPDLIWPDQQIYFNPVTYTTTPTGTRTIINTDPFPGFIIGFSPTRPTSRGQIQIADTDPATKPRIMPNSLATDQDCQMVIDGARLCRAFANTDSIKQLIKTPFNEDVSQMTDDEMLDDFRNRCGTVFHPVGTCRMGANAKNAVVDNVLRVFGVDGLRVVDASVFPNITSANTNAPTMMLAWRAAGIIMEGWS